MRRCVPFVLLLSLLIPSAPLLAHGSITAEGDLCILRIGFYTAHFKIYQPARSGHREYCEDLPATGETLFVMEYQHQALGSVPLEFRILENPTGLGRFTQLQDLAGHDYATVLQHAVASAPDVFTLRHDFLAEGDYVGVVTVGHPATADTYTAVFPFHVGSNAGVAGWLLPLLLLVLAQLLWWGLSGRMPHGAQQNKAAQAVLLVFAVGTGGLPQHLQAAADPSAISSLRSQQGWFEAVAVADVQPLPLNTLHAWTLQLRNASGEPLVDAQVRVEGGMPAHNHGLPTLPVVTPTSTPGRYRIEGMRFHMQGEWELRLTVTQGGNTDLLLIPVRL